MKVFVQGQGEVNLTQQHFVATGGQASVYVRDKIAYKIYTDPKDMIPSAKFQALSAISDSCVIKPDRILLDSKNKHIGYTMQAVGDNYSLCQLFTKTFRDRNKITPDQIVDISAKLLGHVDNVHKASALIVDLNELNILVPHNFSDTFLIDVDSYQTKGYPATVIMPSVRDYSVKATDFSTLSDWFSYAVLAFQLFVGAHPYKGTHAGSSHLPNDQRMVYRMQHRISAFRSDVHLPKCCYPLDAIPQNFRDWLKAVLEDGKRLHPPDPHGGPVAALTTQIATILVSSGNLIITELSNLDGWNLIEYAEVNGGMLTLVSKGHTQEIRSGSRMLNSESSSAKTTVGHTPKMNHPIAFQLENKQLTFLDLERKTRETLLMRVDEIAKSGDRFYIRNGTQVLEVEFSELPTKTIVTASHVVANVLENASRLFEGGVIQNMLGSIYVSLFPKSKAGYQVRIPELDKHKIVDAKFDGGVLMVVGARDGQYDRFVFRFDEEYGSYDLRVVPDVTPSGLNFVTLASGVCVAITEDEKIEAFSAKKGPIKVVDDPMIGNDMRLLKINGKVGFERGGRLYSMSLK